MHQTWTFSEDEGGSTEVSADERHLTIDRHSGPDCDGTTTEQHLAFVLRPADSEWPDGTFVRTGPYREDVTEVLADNPQRAFDDYLDAELGGLLRSRYLIGQSDPEARAAL